MTQQHSLSINIINSKFIPKYHSCPRGISNAKIPVTITINETRVEYDSLFGTGNEIFNFVMGNLQNLDEIPDMNKNWRTI